MAEVGTAYVSILPSARGFGTKLTGQVGGEVKSSGSKMGAMLGATLKVGAAGVAAAAGGVIGTALFSGFKRLNAIDQARAKLSGLGNSTKQVNAIMDNALASVKGTAFGLDEAATTAASVVAAGVKPGRELQGVLKTVADTATIAGKSMADTGAIFGSVAARGKLQGDDLMQLQSAGVPVLAMLAKHYGITAAAASQMVSKGEVDFKNFSDAMQENLGGAALKSGETVSGAFANLKASLGRVGANLLSGVFSRLPGFLAGLTEAMAPLEGMATKVGQALGTSLGKLGPLLSQASAKVQGFFASLGGAGGGGVLASLSNVGSAVAAGVMPVMQAVGRSVGAILPAVGKLGAFVASTLLPVFSAVANVIAGQVVPIVQALARWFYGSLIPAVVKIATAIGGSLAPVFTALASTFKAQILPALTQLLAKFREWQPTIQKVIGVVVQVVGAVLRFAAVILGKVLPPVIKLAGWLIGTLVKAFLFVVQAGVTVVATFFRIGAAVYRASKPLFSFAVAVAGVIGKVIGFVVRLVGRITGGFVRVGAVVFQASRPFLVFVGVVARMVGKVVGFVARLAGRVVGAFVRVGAAVARVSRPFAAFAAGVARAVGRAIGVVSGMVGKVARFFGRVGAVVMGSVRAWARWVTGIGQKIGAALRLVGSIPGKVKSRLGSLGSVLYNAGRALIDGLIRGITARIGALAAKMSEVARKVKGFLPGSPVKEGPLTSWNNGAAGKRLVELLASGIEPEPVERAMRRLSSRVAVGATALGAPGALGAYGDVVVRVYLDGQLLDNRIATSFADRDASDARAVRAGAA